MNSRISITYICIFKRNLGKPPNRGGFTIGVVVGEMGGVEDLLATLAKIGLQMLKGPVMIG